MLPGEVRGKVMTLVMERFLTAYPSLPTEMECRAFLHNNAVQLALKTTKKARLESGNPALWHDESHRSTTPVIDITELQRTDPTGRLVSPHWNILHEQMKPRLTAFLRKQGVPDADAEDLFSETIAGLARVRDTGTAVIDDLLVYEQVPALCMNIARHRLCNYFRHRHAAKRDTRQTTSLQETEDVEDKTDQLAFTTWAADEANPLSGLTFARLAEECAQGLTPLQQRILTILYIEESATYMQVATSPWFAQAAGIKPGAAGMTCRRALDSLHDSALEHLARRLGIDRPSEGGKEI